MNEARRKIWNVSWKHILLSSSLIAGAAIPTYFASRAFTAEGSGEGPPTEAAYELVGGAPQPSLDRTDAARAEEIARANPTISDMLLQGDAQLTSTIAWVGFDGEPIGAVVEFDLQRPVMGKFTLPIADYREELEDSERPYVAYAVEVNVESINGFYVQVNLRIDEVANIIPKDGSKISLTSPRPDLEKPNGESR